MAELMSNVTTDRKGNVTSMTYEASKSPNPLTNLFGPAEAVRDGGARRTVGEPSRGPTCSSGTSSSGTSSSSPVNDKRPDAGAGPGRSQESIAPVTHGLV